MLKDNRKMVDELTRLTGIGPRLQQAFIRADRKHFLPGDVPAYRSYRNNPMPIGFGQTNSQPYTMAFMLKLLEVEEGMTVLDVGSGSCWSTALLRILAGKDGRVAGTERISELRYQGLANLSRAGISDVEIYPATSVPGLPGRSFDRILVSAAADRLPSGLIEQLKPGGRMVIPLGESLYLYKLHKPRLWSTTEYPGFRFVPLL